MLISGSIECVIFAFMLGWWAITLPVLGTSLVEAIRLRKYPTRVGGEVDSDLSVSLVIPAHNEESNIPDCLNAVALQSHPIHQVIVINDGSDDQTLTWLTDTYDMEGSSHRQARLERVGIEVRQVYNSQRWPELLVIDKEGSGKARSLNAGLGLVEGDVVIFVDADTILHSSAVASLVAALSGGKSVSGVSGLILPAVPTERPLSCPVSLLLIELQIVEYSRMCMLDRLGLSKLGILPIAPGCMSAFRSDVVSSLGGVPTGTVSEDLELSLLTLRSFGGRLVVRPGAVCCTQIPRSAKSLISQRDRWHRGLLEVTWRSRDLLGRPRWGRLGLVTLPYLVMTQGLMPAVGLLSAIVYISLLALGYAQDVELGRPSFFMGVGVAFDISLSVVAVHLSSSESTASVGHKGSGGRRPSYRLGALVLTSTAYVLLQWLIKARAWVRWMRRVRTW